MICKGCSNTINFTETECQYCSTNQYPFAGKFETAKLPNTDENIQLKAKDAAQRAVVITLIFIKLNKDKYSILAKDEQPLDIAWFITCFFAHLAVRQTAYRLGSQHLEELFLGDFRAELIICFVWLNNRKMSTEKINQLIYRLAAFNTQYSQY